MPVLLLLLVLRGHATVPDHALVDRIVASVDRELVLASEIVLGQELAPLDPGPLPFWSRPTDAAQQRIDATLIRVAASDIGVYQPSTAEVQVRGEALRDRFVDRAAWEAFLDHHGLDDVSLRQELRRRLIVERFLTRNLTVDPADRSAWFAATDALLEALRRRVRIRRIPLEPPAPEIEL